MRVILPILLLACSPVALDDDLDGDCPPDSCIAHDFGPSPTLGPGEERDGICFSWTVENEEQLLVNAVTATNAGWFHHSNWFWVPESEWDLPDGYWDCGENDFSEIQAALVGGVLFAQSTQLDTETQQFLPGYAVRVPPRARVIAFAHLLNWSGDTVTSNLDVRMDLLRADALIAALAPSRFSYLDLDIPAQAATEHAGACTMRTVYEYTLDRPFDAKLHYVLPHFHGLGQGFTARWVGGPHDGEPIWEIHDAWGHAFGHTFDAPLDLSEADGIRFACEHENLTDRSVGWGIGDQEMCVALLFLESGLMMENTVLQTATTGVDGDVLTREGTCITVGAPFTQ